MVFKNKSNIEWSKLLFWIRLVCRCLFSPSKIYLKIPANGCGSREKTTLITRTSLEILWFRLGWIAIVIYDKELCYCCKIRHFWIILQKSVSFSRTATWLQVLMEWEWSWTSKWKWTKTPSPQINLSVWYLLNPIILEFYKSYSCRCLHLCDSYDL